MFSMRWNHQRALLKYQYIHVVDGGDFFSTMP
jgi:hypothetical protein